MAKISKFLLYSIIVLLSSCFKVREPELPEPVTGNNIGWENPTEPEILLQNFINAVKQINIPNYLRCIDDLNFSFEPDPVVRGNNQGIFDNWAFNEESEYFKNLDAKKGKTTENDLIFINAQSFNYTLDSLEYSADYKLILDHKDTAFNNNNNELAGKLIFILIRENNNWLINSWQDIKDTTLCWSDLKANFITQ